MTPNPQDSAVALEVERAIREALDSFPKGWHTVFNEVRERHPGVVEIGALWEDSDSLAEVITVDTGNYYDNASAMPMAKFIAACNPEAMRTLLAEIDRLRASQSDGTSGKEMEALRDQRDALMRALEVIAVGDSPDPVTEAGDELVALGYWRKEGLDGHRALMAAAPSKSQGENHVG